VTPPPIPTHGYVGRCKCNGVILLCGADGDRRTAKDVAAVIRRGGSVSRLTIDECRAAAPEFGCRCPKAPRKRKAPTPTTEPGR
jgi:hypothetical protein